MPTILILTHTKDDTADLVIRHLRNTGADFVRFNTDEFQTKVKFTVHLSEDGTVTGQYRFPDRLLNFSEIGVVWNRRVHTPKLGTDLDFEPELKEWMKDESEWGMNNSFTLIDAPFINPWEVNERLKFNKWIQMKRAVELGLDVPISCLTNEEAAIREFWGRTGHDMIFKKIRKGLFRFRDGRTLLVHTNKVPAEKMTDAGIGRMRFCPMFLQKCIAKKYDVRVVVVHEQVFSVAIHSQKVPEGVVDFRKAALLGKLDQMDHEVIDLGEELNRKLVRFVQSFGSVCGAIDLVVTPEDRVVFLEDNPNGQWGWLEQKTSIPISKAIADLLISVNHNPALLERR